MQIKLRTEHLFERAQDEGRVEYIQDIQRGSNGRSYRTIHTLAKYGSRQSRIDLEALAGFLAGLGLGTEELAAMPIGELFEITPDEPTPTPVRELYQADPL